MDYLLCFLLAGGIVPLAFIATAAGCCCATGCPSVCVTASRPANMQVTLSGMVNGDCGCCNDYNTTYTLPLNGTPENISGSCGTASSEPTGTARCCYETDNPAGCRRANPAACTGVISFVGNTCCEIYASGGTVGIHVFLRILNTTNSLTEWGIADSGIGSSPGDCSTISMVVLPLISHAGTLCGESASVCIVSAV